MKTTEELITTVLKSDISDENKVELIMALTKTTIDFISIPEIGRLDLTSPSYPNYPNPWITYCSTQNKE